MATIKTVAILRTCIFMGCEYIGKPIKMCLLPLFTKHAGQSGETFSFPRVFFPNCNKLRGSEHFYDFSFSSFPNPLSAGGGRER